MSSDAPPKCALGPLGLPPAFVSNLTALKGKLALVTGGVGFLGGHIVSVLLQAGARVRVFDVVLPRENHAAWKKSDPVEVLKGDLNNKEEVTNACAGVWCVIHVASPSPTSNNAELFHRVNVLGTSTLLQACRDQGVQRFVHTSSASVVFDGQDQRNFDESAPKPVAAMDAYTKSKWDAEILVLHANKDDQLWTTAIRPHGIFGARDPHFLPVLAATGAKGKSKFQIGDGANLVDFTYVENVAYAHALAAVQLKAGGAINGKAYFITNREPVFFWDLISRLHAAWGWPLPRIPLPVPLMRPMAKVSEWLGGMLKFKPTFTTQAINYAGVAHYYSSARAVREMNYQPPIDMDEAIRRSLNYYWDLRNQDSKAVLARLQKANRGSKVVAPKPTYGFAQSTLLKAIVILTVVLAYLWARGSMTLFLTIVALLGAYGWSMWKDSFGAAPVMYRSRATLTTTAADRIQTDAEDKVILITGANRGLGYHTAIDLLDRGYTTRGGAMYLTSRDAAKGAEVLANLQKRYPAAKLHSVALDLASFESVRACVKSLKASKVSIDVLIHNAGAMLEAGVTKDGHDVQFQSNFLGHVYLTRMLLKENMLAPAARIVNVSSMMHRGVGLIYGVASWEDMQDLKDRSAYHRLSMYCRTKLLQIVYAGALQRQFNAEANAARLQTTGGQVSPLANRRTVVSVNPGAVATDFIHHFIPESLAKAIEAPLMAIIEKTPKQGVQAIVYAAVAQEMDNVGGVYVDNCRVCLPSALARDEDLQNAIYEKANAWVPK